MELAVSLADTTNIKVFSENLGHPELTKIVIIKKCPKLLSIYSEWWFFFAES